jgi:SAM-dependent methyltransferase
MSEILDWVSKWPAPSLSDAIKGMTVRDPVCRVCGNVTDNRLYVAREMMYGTKEPFSYYECASCFSLQILEVPEDLSRYYPDDYSGSQRLQSTTAVEQHKPNGIRLFVRQQRVRYTLYGTNPLGWLVAKARPDYFGYDWDWFRIARVEPDSRILDVGCGPGWLLSSLQGQGFTNLTGQDLFQKWGVKGLNILRSPLSELEGVFDFIMLHHSFEHMPDPLAALKDIKRLCAPHGVVLIRLPVAGCLAWKEYGTDWYQIDAPRHLVIPSRKGMDVLAERAGLDLFRVAFDSDERQFCGSEQYRQGIPFRDPRSYLGSPRSNTDTNLFSLSQISSFQAKAREANIHGEGDQACFYFRKP